MNLRFLAACTVLVMAMATGCKQQASNTSPIPSTQPVNSSAYFKTPFQDESQFIVEAIASDLAEQMYYAAYHRLPDAKYFDVSATEKPGSPQDAPVYDVQIHLDPKQGVLSSEVNVNGPIWSPAIYQDLAEALAQSAGVNAINQKAATDTSFLAKLTDSSPETIEQENQDLSSSLEGDFQNPQLHEEAAVLLGAFLMRDHSGHFFEILSPLSRMTAHLAMAQFLKGTHSFGVNGEMANAMMLTLVNDQAAALDQLNAIGTNDDTVAPMVRALWTRNTGDYRLLGQRNNLSPIESIEWFRAYSDYVHVELAWSKLNDSQQAAIDFVRIANEEDYSVEMGHQITAISLPLEYREIQNIYELWHHQRLPKDGMVQSLNEMPERCFTVTADGTAHVRVIGWGQWADFFQRHLCHAIQQNFYFLQNKWGVPDDAKEFTANAGKYFQGLRLYPFVERFDCTDEASYHQSVDDGLKVTIATPQLTPADCWNWICYKVDFAPRYMPSSNPHVNEWHHHNPPPGTVYDLNPRLNHPSLTERPDALDFFQKLHELAPYDCRITGYILKNKYNKGPNYEQAAAYYQGMDAYSLSAAFALANSAYDDPKLYEKLMLQAAQLDPVSYYSLGDYEDSHTNYDQAAAYYQMATDKDQDSVRASNYALWQVQYYLYKGNIEKARQIADFGGQIYSYRGLQAEGLFYQTISNYATAFDWYQKLEDRYNDSSPLIAFCLLYKEHTGDTQFDPEVKKREDKLFPKGIEKVSVSDFQGPPADGVLIQEEDNLTADAGLKKDDVIVALDGTRLHNFLQYRFVRDGLAGPELDLIVWKRGSYEEVKASPPNHLFGVPFGDFQPQ
jgi:hypothetical protein